uniref:G-protein coupled receptors family 1 profile domain-containing protein n=1 Tax=Loxodonta africana TaxID=9785 RepID=G3U496_LOXAF
MALGSRSLAALFVYIISFLIGLPANLLALRAFARRLRQPHPAPIHILLLNLTLADLLLLLLLPFKMVEAMYNFHWLLGDILCALTGYGFYSSIYCSTWLLAGISIERYRSVAFPVHYKLSRRPVYGVMAAVVSWVLSLGHCSIVIIVQYLPTSDLDLVVPVRLELCMVLFLIPVVVTIFCYWRFVRIMLSRSQVGAQKRWRAVGLAAVTLFNFLVCFGPYNVSHVVGFFKKQSVTWRAYAVLLSALNACIDPLIFYFSSSLVRRDFDKGLQRLQNWGTSLSGCWRRRTQERATTKADESLGTRQVYNSSQFLTQ